MTSKTLTRMVVTTIACLSGAHALARDPGDVDTGRRAPSNSPPTPRQPQQQPQRFVPERIDPTDLHGKPQPRPTERRRLYERVEDDIDRGNGRVEDEQTHQVRRHQDDRDERLRRIPPQREAERFQEDYDRQQRIDARGQRVREQRREAESAAKRQGARPETIVQAPPDRPISTLSRAVAEDEQRLTSARERYQSDLRAAEVERDDAIRSGTTRQAKATAERRFTERRGELTIEYQALRRRILGRE